MKRFREEFEGGGVEAFAYIDDAPLGLMTNKVRAFSFLRRELEDTSFVVNTAKTAAIPPKWHASTAEEFSLLESVGFCMLGEGGVTVVGVPIGPDESLLERALEVVRDGGAGRLAYCLANMPHR